MTGDGIFRWLLGVVLIAGVGISAYHRWKARRTGEVIPRSRESPLLIAGRLVVGLPLLVSLVAYLVNPEWLAWSRLPLPERVRWLGVILGFVAVGLIYWVVRSLGSNISETVLTKREHELVTHGPYRWVRHPLYAVGTLLLLAAALMMASWFVAALALLAAVMIRIVVIPLEEAALVARFGDRYVDYRAGTGRLLPRAHRRNEPGGSPRARGD